MSIKTIILASSNIDKFKELHDLLGCNYKIYNYRDYFNEDFLCIEDGKTFKDNAIKKINTCKKIPDTIYVADDSGLEVDYLNGAPGVLSARYAGENACREKLCKKILFELGNDNNRKARFVSIIAILLPFSKKPICVSGSIKGNITKKMYGHNGFGYDAIFRPEGLNKTFAEMNLNEKNKYSHRAKAIKKAKKLIQKHF
jgi:XTP/dITP diphosphohydrolase